MKYRKRKTSFNGWKNVKKNIWTYQTATENSTGVTHALSANDKFKLESNTSKSAAGAALLQF